ncbi:MAG: hypothetical protein P8P66_02250 [Paracoccaceae bacterium]|nr:hypothetical protein [Paracoccaceae bacterium]MDG2451926.1 hypothetical protein [Paracoccaceae bacterium]
MSKSIKSVAMVGLLVLAAACARSTESQVEEFVVVDPAPITIEPAHTGKYK